MFCTKFLRRLISMLTLCIIGTLYFGPSVDAGSPRPNFKWVYHYDAAQNEGDLSITIYDSSCKVPQNTYVYPSVCTAKKDHIACEVDIQAAANDAYNQEGHDSYAGSAESYPLIYAEVIGSMGPYRSAINETIIRHPSLVYNLQTGIKGNSARFVTNWTGIGAQSDFFTYNPSASHLMRTSFGQGKFTHVVDASVLNMQNASTSYIPFRLDKTTFEIFQPKGFILDSFTVDPPRCGFG